MRLCGTLCRCQIFPVSCCWTAVAQEQMLLFQCDHESLLLSCKFYQEWIYVLDKHQEKRLKFTSKSRASLWSLIRVVSCQLGKVSTCGAAEVQFYSWKKRFNIALIFSSHLHLLSVTEADWRQEGQANKSLGLVTTNAPKLHK